MLKTVPEYTVNNQTILQEHFDENYEPTPDEIREYAIYIGIDPETVTDSDSEKRVLTSILLGITSVLAGERRNHEAITRRLETLPRGEWRTLLLQFRYRQILVGASLRWDLQITCRGRTVSGNSIDDANGLHALFYDYPEGE